MPDNLQTMDASRNYHEWIPAGDSTCLRQYIYWEDRRGNRYFDVQFKDSGRLYRYHDVPESLAFAMKRAPSRGKFFNRYIKGKYPFSPL